MEYRYFSLSVGCLVALCGIYMAAAHTARGGLGKKSHEEARPNGSQSQIGRGTRPSVALLVDIATRLLTYLLSFVVDMYYYDTCVQCDYAFWQQYRRYAIFQQKK